MKRTDGCAKSGLVPEVANRVLDAVRGTRRRCPGQARTPLPPRHKHHWGIAYLAAARRLGGGSPGAQPGSRAAAGVSCLQPRRRRAPGVRVWVLRRGNARRAARGAVRGRQRRSPGPLTCHGQTGLMTRLGQGAWAALWAGPPSLPFSLSLSLVFCHSPLFSISKQRRNEKPV